LYGFLVKSIRDNLGLCFLSKEVSSSSKGSLTFVTTLVYATFEIGFGAVIMLAEGPNIKGHIVGTFLMPL
jgi:hypothetical protein